MRNWLKDLSVVVVAASLCFFAAIQAAQAKPPMNWRVFDYAYTEFDTLKSEQAQDGETLAIIDGTALNFADYLEKHHYEYQPEGFLYQTIDASQYRGKHLHISAFARNIRPDFEKLENLFSEQLTEIQKLMGGQNKVGSHSPQQASYLKKRDAWRAERHAAVTSNFSKHIRDSYAQSRYGIWVLLHMEGGTKDQPKIRKFSPTSTGNISTPERWQRFNIEVSIPEHCHKITVVFWSWGVSKAQVDHFAIVEHGPELNRSDYGEYFSSFDRLYEKLILKDDQTAEAELRNLSFERQ